MHGLWYLYCGPSVASSKNNLCEFKFILSVSSRLILKDVQLLYLKGANISASIIQRGVNLWTRADKIIVLCWWKSVAKKSVDIAGVTQLPLKENLNKGEFKTANKGAWEATAHSFFIALKH